MSFVDRCPLFGVSFSEVLQRIPYSGIFSLVQDFAESLLGPSEIFVSFSCSHGEPRPYFGPCARA